LQRACIEKQSLQMEDSTLLQCKSNKNQDEIVPSDSAKRCDTIRAENMILQQQLEGIRKKRQAVQMQITIQENTKIALEQRLNELATNRNENLISYQSAASGRNDAKNILCLYQNVNVMNDCFHIWYDGPFATINGLRLGAEAAPPVVEEDSTSLQSNASTDNRRYLYFSNTDSNPSSKNQSPANIKVPWKEINAAIGQVALLISTLEKKPNTGIKLRCEIKPTGSTSKIGVRHGLTSTTTYYNLYYVEETFQFFGKRNFNTALQYLVQCIADIVNVVTKRDRTIILPYSIEQKAQSGRNANVEFLIGGLPIAHGIDDIEWTRAMKYLLTDIKHIMIYKPFSFPG
jgi:beclin